MKLVKVKNTEEAISHLSDKQRLGLEDNFILFRDKNDLTYFFLISDLESNMILITIVDNFYMDIDIEVSEFSYLIFNRDKLNFINDFLDGAKVIIYEDIKKFVDVD